MCPVLACLPACRTDHPPPQRPLHDIYTAAAAAAPSPALQGRQEFSPAPGEVASMVQAYYAVPRNLLLRFRDDSIDDSVQLAALLQGNSAIASQLDLSLRTLEGGHTRPMAAALGELPPDVAAVANRAAETGGQMLGAHRRSRQAMCSEHATLCSALPCARKCYTQVANLIWLCRFARAQASWQVSPTAWVCHLGHCRTCVQASAAWPVYLRPRPRPLKLEAHRTPRQRLRTSWCPGLGLQQLERSHRLDANLLRRCNSSCSTRAL
jgi:Protein of unknown function (DUF1350)